jgi:hypothetical protein
VFFVEVAQQYARRNGRYRIAQVILEGALSKPKFAVHPALVKADKREKSQNEPERLVYDS